MNRNPLALTLILALSLAGPVSASPPEDPVTVELLIEQAKAVNYDAQGTAVKLGQAASPALLPPPPRAPARPCSMSSIGQLS